MVYCGSFSKSIAPALRLGYLVADWDLLQHILAAKTDAGTGALAQMVLAEYGPAHFKSHVTALTATLRDKCQVMMEALEANFGTAAEFTAPKGGIFIWIALPKAVNTTALAAAAGAEGVTLNPGAEWTADPATGQHRLRLCFGNPTPNRSARASPSWPTFATAPRACRNGARMWSAVNQRPSITAKIEKNNGAADSPP